MAYEAHKKKRMNDLRGIHNYHKIQCLTNSFSGTKQVFSSSWFIVGDLCGSDDRSRQCIVWKSHVMSEYLIETVFMQHKLSILISAESVIFCGNLQRKLLYGRTCVQTM